MKLPTLSAVYNPTYNHPGRDRSSLSSVGGCTSQRHVYVGLYFHCLVIHEPGYHAPISLSFLYQVLIIGIMMRADGCIRKSLISTNMSKCHEHNLKPLSDISLREKRIVYFAAHGCPDEPNLDLNQNCRVLVCGTRGRNFAQLPATRSSHSVESFQSCRSVKPVSACYQNHTKFCSLKSICLTFKRKS